MIFVSIEYPNCFAKCLSSGKSRGVDGVFGVSNFGSGFYTSLELSSSNGFAVSEIFPDTSTDL